MKETANSLDQKKNSLYEPCTSSTSSEIAYLGKIIRKIGIICPDTLKIEDFMKETPNSLDLMKNSLHERHTSYTSSEIT